jgi:exodeoxyribonuclease III
MRLVTWNVNSLTARLPRVVEWLEANQPDVVCLQETKQAQDAFPYADLKALGYEAVHHGEGRWNGVAIVSKVGIEDPAAGLGADQEAQGARMVAATCGGVRVHSVYVPNGRSLESEHYTAKLVWLARLREYLDGHYSSDEAVAVCGDFNVAPSDGDLWDPAAFVGMTHASAEEREALEGVLAWGLEDVFAIEHPEGGIFSWWDYRAGDFHQGRGMRIDLVLLSRGLAERAVSSYVDRDARKGKKPSDHAPVVVHFEDGISS